MKLWEFFFWFATITIVGCCTTKPKPNVPNLQSLMDPRGYCIERCEAVGMKAINFVMLDKQVLCACVDIPKDFDPQ